jgi:hypothetical protein
MSKSIFYLCLVFTISGFAQTPKLGSLETGSKTQSSFLFHLNAGSRFFGKLSDAANEAPSLAISSGFGYAFNKWSLVGRLDYYNHFLIPGFLGEAETVTRSFGASLVGNFDMIHIISGIPNSNWKVDAYIGAGLTTSWNSDLRNLAGSNPDFPQSQDPFIEGNDDMGHILFGATPKYFFNDAVGVGIDISTFLLFSQDFTYDYLDRITGEGLGSIMTFSFGVYIKPQL